VNLRDGHIEIVGDFLRRHLGRHGVGARVVLGRA
jgi:hypothetical protein